MDSTELLIKDIQGKVPIESFYEIRFCSINESPYNFKTERYVLYNSAYARALGIIYADGRNYVNCRKIIKNENFKPIQYENFFTFLMLGKEVPRPIKAQDIVGDMIVFKKDDLIVYSNIAELS